MPSTLKQLVWAARQTELFPLGMMGVSRPVVVVKPVMSSTLLAWGACTAPLVCSAALLYNIDTPQSREVSMGEEASMKHMAWRLLCLVMMVAFPILACGLPPLALKAENSSEPGSPVYSVSLFDCNTGELVSPGALIQPRPGCDNWEVNRYERPFNAGGQDDYHPDLDILSAAMGRSQYWYYVRLELYDVDQETGHLQGVYGLEIDLDLDGRGDVLITAQIVDTEHPSTWSNLGVQAWVDSNNDVGNALPMQPDAADDNDGYDLATIDPQAPSDAVWVRATPGKPSLVEIAFKPQVLDGDETFKWWVWADEGIVNPAAYDYHDFYALAEAGDVYSWHIFFPAKELFSVDNTCASLWGLAPPPDDPSLCINDPLFLLTPTWTSVPPSDGCCNLCCDGGYATFTPTWEMPPTRVTPTWTPTATPTPTPTPTLTPTPTATRPRPTPVPPTPTECRNPFGGPCN
jgi:hypothetical protein